MVSRKINNKGFFPLLISGIIFVFIFISSYIILSYLPSLRIKLYAPPKEYFIESIRHMVVFKSIVAIGLGLLVVSIPYILKKHK